MIKNEWTATNEQVGAVRNDLKHNREFGSLFQFFKCIMLDEACRYFEVNYDEPPKTVNIDYETLHNLCIKLLNILS